MTRHTSELTYAAIDLLTFKAYNNNKFEFIVLLKQGDAIDRDNRGCRHIRFIALSCEQYCIRNGMYQEWFSSNFIY